VINVGYDRKEIVAAIHKSVTHEMVSQAHSVVNPYGTGGASKRIVEVLKNIEINEALLQKEMTY
jgi:UDP-N-acetylglucosamine 2-epimerase